MKLNQAHTVSHKKEFAALKWCIENAKLNIEDEGYKGYIFQGRIPHYQIQHLVDLKRLGYEHPGDSEILNMSWVVGNNHHGVSVNFKSRNIKVTHNVSKLTEAELVQYQAA